jgi:hypothetical protein
MQVHHRRQQKATSDFVQIRRNRPNWTRIQAIQVEILCK